MKMYCPYIHKSIREYAPVSYELSKASHFCPNKDLDNWFENNHEETILVIEWIERDFDVNEMVF